MRSIRLAAFATHPIQYYSPWFATLADYCDLTVFYADQQTPEGQTKAGFSTAFSWDVPLLEGYKSEFLRNISKRPGLAGYFGANTPEITQRIAHGGFDALLMLGWYKLAFAQGWLGAMKAGIPVLIRVDSQLGSYRGRLTRLLKEPVYRLVLPRAADYLSPGERSDTYLRHYGVPEERIHRLVHMIDVDRFSVAARTARQDHSAAGLRAQHGATCDEIVFLYVGKLIDKKRPLLLINALAKLKVRASEGPPFSLWIVGDGPLEAEVAARAQALSIRVKRLGFVNQMSIPRVYAAADCLVLPSNADETWGLVVNEAQACGLPAIVSVDAGCSPELIDDEVTGWTLRHANPDTLADLLQQATLQARALPRDGIFNKARMSTYKLGAEALMGSIESVLRRRETLTCRDTGSVDGRH